MTDFTASNGITLSFDDQGRFMYSRGGIDPIYVGKTGGGQWWGFTVNSRIFQALSEYAQAKEDERLGRWRWPENPDITVRAINDGLVGVVKDDRDGRAYGQFRRGDHTSCDPMSQAARAYFDAHPKPKPAWHDAKEGEVWELTFPAAASAWFVNGDFFQSTKTLTNIYKIDRGILSARRIYPEAE